MTNTNFWLLKLNALLHDPPDKPLDIREHQGKAQQWAKALGLTLSRDDFKQADWVASAADRLNFPSYQSIGGVDFRQEPYLTHPLSGARLNLSKGKLLPDSIDEKRLNQAIQNSLESIDSSIRQDPQWLFLWLWRNWSAQIKRTEGNQLESLWDLLPADIRIPDHSIWAHQALTSAIAATESDPAFLLFTIGPVQSFISAARRTQDLWAGSYLLSYLTWAAIEEIVEAIGPDAVIFPNLLGQPLCDRWLKQKYQITSVDKPLRAEDLILPSLPNRFLAIVPAKQGKDLAKRAEVAVQQQWQCISKAVRLDLEKILGSTPAWSETWDRQTNNLFETYWQIYPWLPEGHPIQDKNYRFFGPHQRYLGRERSQKMTDILQLYAKSDKDGGGRYNPNIGAIYRELHFITEKVLGSRKGLRDFPQVAETGEKSTLGGDRASLYDGIDHLNLPEENFDLSHGGRSKIIKFWNTLAQRLQRHQRFEIKESGERLDATELTKRCVWRSYFQKQAGFEYQEEATEAEKEYELRFPSTSSVATASFKAAIIAQLQQSESESLRSALNEWIKDVYDISAGNRINRGVIPYLADKVDKRNGLLNKFLRLDGRLLFEETYQDTKEWINPDEARINQARQSLKNFLKTAYQEYKIPKPRKYFAVLMMDGDGMGQWIAGDKMPKYREVLHPKTQEALQQLSDWQGILESDRLMSPAIHGFVSKALGDFSLKLVRHIVETLHPGKLVYAGGDDVLALLPLDHTLEVARELRAAFSGEIYTGDIGTDIDKQIFDATYGDVAKEHSGYIWVKFSGQKKPELLATMGRKATASTGIAIAHHTQPLDITLQEVRRAEKSAKSKEGRNAFSLTFLKRSGETMSAGAKWAYVDKPRDVEQSIDSEKQTDEKTGEKELKLIDTMQVLLEFQAKFADGSLSSKFPYILREEAETLSLLEITELYTAEIKRLLLRQQGEKKLTPDERKQFTENLSSKLATLVMNANHEQRSHAKDIEKDKPQGKLATFADLLVFTRFLATGEGEED